jgi:hypothetical protein
MPSSPFNRPSFRLFVFIQSGCQLCDQAQLILPRFQAAHPEAMVVKTQRRELNGFVAKATPTYLFVAEGLEPHAHTGLLSLEEMEQVYLELFPDDEDDEEAPHTEKDFGRKRRGSDEEE